MILISLQGKENRGSNCVKNSRQLLPLAESAFLDGLGKDLTFLQLHLSYQSPFKSMTRINCPKDCQTDAIVCPVTSLTKITYSNKPLKWFQFQTLQSSAANLLSISLQSNNKSLVYSFYLFSHSPSRIRPGGD